MLSKKKKDYNFFDAFEAHASLIVKAAKALEDLLTSYTDVTNKADLIHEIEHEADDIHHEVIRQLHISFITPIDREDIIFICENIDSAVDSIEDVSNMMDMFSISKVRPEAIQMAKFITAGALALNETMKEFKNFRNSKKLTPLVVAVNKCEEDGDYLYRKTIKDMYLSETNVIELIKWKEIFDTMEATLDLLEEIANALESVAIKNN